MKIDSLKVSLVRGRVLYIKNILFLTGSLVEPVRRECKLANASYKMSNRLYTRSQTARHIDIFYV